ncbi:nuclear pore complex protein Nup88 [Microplitis demolitor]|uniref:nuclear pore complex protein Nup88 n=1 Tax=Microplitis demolitor TaxID=69319 RepID=UPI0006D4E40D|nr:nuclear pore complex protein Nup88 [Microplitis demolitor]
MASCTDRLKLNDHELFKLLKNDMPKSDKETRNIIEIRDDILYAWNTDKCCLFVLILGDNFNPSAPYQTLQLTDPPIFEVTNISINEASTQLVLWGSLGIVILELPRRWGKNNLFQGGKQSISCINHNLNRLTSQLSSSEVRRVRWHPGSPNDSHLLILTSENSFQLFECPLGNKPKLIKNWKVGPTPMLSPSKTLPNIESLGETAVDFDFSTPTIPSYNYNKYGKFGNFTKETPHWSDIEWPILVLRGDGNVFLIYGNILSNSNQKPLVQGSLSIYPASFDNYGVDSCSIVCLPTTPPLVAIATSTGLIHHAILLCDNSSIANVDNLNKNTSSTEDSTLNQQNDDSQKQFDRKKTWSEYGSNYSLHTPDDGLFVFETIEMQLGLLFSDNDKKYNCFINLHRDRGNKGRYFCTHNAGVHMITLPVASQLTDYLNCSEDNIDLYLPSSIKPSISQYLICTRTKHTGADEATPVLGFGLLEQPTPIVIALLYSGVVVNFSVIDFDYPSAVDSDEPVINSNNTVTRESFENYIKNLLKHNSTSQPITKLGMTSTLNGKECFEFLDCVTNVLRGNYFVKHDHVRNEIGKKVRALKALKIHQLNELNNLMQIKAELHDKAQHLAERYEDIKEHQEELTRRSREVLRQINHKELTAAERTEALELKELNRKVDEFTGKFDRLKNKVDNQLIKNDLSIDKSNQDISNVGVNKKTQLILGEKQEEVIKNSLRKMGDSIAELIGQVKILEEDLEV